MTIKLKMDEFAEQFQEAGAKKLPCDPTDALDSTFKFNLPYSQGWGRRITLREDIKITIDQNQIRDRMILTYPEVAADYIACNFYLSGGCEINTTYTTSQTSQHTDPAGSYVLSSTGSRGLMIANHGTTLFSSVGITFHQSTLRSFIASLDEELPNHLKHLTGSVEKKKLSPLWEHSTSNDYGTTANLALSLSGRDQESLPGK